MPCPLSRGAAYCQDPNDSTPEAEMNTLLSSGPSSLSLFNSPSPFLALPGEIRNQIYRAVLVLPSPFAVKVQFAPRDTALLRVNKQVFKEASAIFYHESTFQILEGLFVGAPILQQMENFYHLPRWRLKRMRNLILDVPVYGRRSDSRLREQTGYNLSELTYCLTPPLGQDPHELKIQLQLKPVWGEDIRRLDPELYWPLLNSAIVLRGRGVDTQVHVHTHPRYLDEWVDTLVSNHFL
ncbi:hypothetical protein OEA41_003756 [Lepraria neglecta]|uniref:Uncharacterized protein n=1 Tax=Lepraria neglecta TaxID=209136 RepID=A0AAE0DIP9_9LECA|nr:hypothetical protein OEA41_003756 [Lepraria neglecta]